MDRTWRPWGEGFPGRHPSRRMLGAWSPPLSSFPVQTLPHPPPVPLPSDPCDSSTHLRVTSHTLSPGSSTQPPIPHQNSLLNSWGGYQYPTPLSRGHITGAQTSQGSGLKCIFTSPLPPLSPPLPPWLGPSGSGLGLGSWL